MEKYKENLSVQGRGCLGATAPDTITGHGGRYSINDGRGGDNIDVVEAATRRRARPEGKRGRDCTTDTPTGDAVEGGRGDAVDSKDNDARDVVTCGRGTDTVTYDGWGPWQIPSRYSRELAHLDVRALPKTLYLPDRGPGRAPVFLCAADEDAGGEDQHPTQDHLRRGDN